VCAGLGGPGASTKAAAAAGSRTLPQSKEIEKSILFCAVPLNPVGRLIFGGSDGGGGGDDDEDEDEDEDVEKGKKMGICV